MPQTRTNKSTVPVNSDAWNLCPDLATLADSLSVVFPVFSQAERDGLATKVANVTTVARMDIGGYPTERWDGTNWVRVQFIDYGNGTAKPYQMAGLVSGLTTNTNGDGQFTIPNGGFPTALNSATLTDASLPANLGALYVKWTASSSSKTVVTFRIYGSGGTALNITSAVLNLTYNLTGY